MPRGGITHSERDPPILIINHENAPLDIARDQSDKGIFLKWDSIFPNDPSLCQDFMKPTITLNG